MEVFTKNAGETQKAGQEFANNLKGGETLALNGNLGSGKTTFIQGLAKGLGVKSRIISPTFILMREYERGGVGGHGGRLYHIDLYRLENNVEEELRNLGIKEVWGKRENIVAIEWAEKVKRMLPRKTVWINFENLGGDKRSLTLGDKRQIIVQKD